MKIKAGDYFVFNKALYRIMDINGVHADVKSFDGKPGIIRGVYVSLIKSYAKIIPEENMTENYKVLYTKTLT